MYLRHHRLDRTEKKSPKICTGMELENPPQGGEVEGFRCASRSEERRVRSSVA